MMKKHTLYSYILALSLVVPVLFPASSLAREAEEDPATRSVWPFRPLSEVENIPSTLTEEGRVTFTSETGEVRFVSGDPLDMQVVDEGDAVRYGYHWMDLENADLKLLRRDDFRDITVYTFQQMNTGEEFLSGRYLRLFADSDGTVLGLSSSLTRDPDSSETEPEAEDATDIDFRALYGDWVENTLEMSVRTVSDTEITVSLPVMTDPGSGLSYLVDPDRRIMLVDLDNLEDVDSRLDAEPLCVENLTTDSPLVSYAKFIDVYDFFRTQGWAGPDGTGSPSLLQIALSGEGGGNASYAGKQEGCHIFNFSVDDGASQATSVIAHEFMHGVSDTNHIGPYENQTGALNESISDIIGNAVDASLTGYGFESDVFLNGFLTNHRDQYPLYVWDAYYTPRTAAPDSSNDLGSVHHNAFVVTMLTYRMAEAGVSPHDRFAYWMLMDLSLTPETEFAEIGAKAAWCAEIAGLTDYMGILQDAAESLRLGSEEPPEDLPESQSLIRLVTDQDPDSPVVLTLVNEDTQSSFTTWTDAKTGALMAVVDEGTYYLVLGDPNSTPLYFWTGDGFAEAPEGVDPEDLQMGEPVLAGGGSFMDFE